MSLPQTERPAETFAELFEAITHNIETVISGKHDLVQMMVLCLVAEGHLLLEDAPGVGKTSLGKALAMSIKAEFGRVQFTPDLLPSDVVGVTVFNRGKNTFEFRPGPIFAGVLLADEINRASPKTQSALLEAMAEQQVTVDGVTHPLPHPSMVIATQNPLEHEGTYPLPDSQLDRFLMRLNVGYPSREAEIQILDTHGQGDPISELTASVSASNVLGMIRAAEGVFVDPKIKGYLIDLADASRRHPSLALGMSPRATLSLQRVCRARAAAAGRSFVTPDDVKALAEPVLAHRLMLNPESQFRGVTESEVVHQILDALPIPRGVS